MSDSVPLVPVIEFAPLSSVDPDRLLALLNDPKVIRHMPLAGPEPMDREALRDWIAGKEAITQQHGYGPQAILLDGTFAGWGGLEPDDGGASIAIVLFPAFWGWGGRIARVLVDEALKRLGRRYVTVEFPPSRKRVRGLLDLGFHVAGETEIFGERFVVYRLDASPE